jgi:hypothetical protein
MWMLTGPEPDREGATRFVADHSVEKTGRNQRSRNFAQKLDFHSPVDKMGIVQRDRQYA